VETLKEGDDLRDQNVDERLEIYRKEVEGEGVDWIQKNS
jgi:hypothetical protein